jgi:hypothetical protein
MAKVPLTVNMPTLSWDVYGDSTTGGFVSESTTTGTTFQVQSAPDAVLHRKVDRLSEEITELRKAIDDLTFGLSRRD